MARDDQVDGMIRRAVEFLRGEIEVSRVVVFGSSVSGARHVAGMKFLDKVKLATDLQLSCGAELEPHFFPASALTNAQPGSFVKHILDTGRRAA